MASSVKIGSYADPSANIPPFEWVIDPNSVALAYPYPPACSLPKYATLYPASLKDFPKVGVNLARSRIESLLRFDQHHYGENKVL